MKYILPKIPCVNVVVLIYYPDEIGIAQSH